MNVHKMQLLLALVINIKYDLRATWRSINKLMQAAACLTWSVTQQNVDKVCSGNFRVHDVLIWNYFEFTM